MILKINEVIFTNISKEWKPYMRNGKWFNMLHINTEEWWMSKYYKLELKNPLVNLDLNKQYDISFSTNWSFKNLMSIKDLNWNIII
jgi:hypothetical protein